MKALAPVLFIACFSHSVQLCANPLEGVLRDLERQQMLRLGEQQNRPGVVIDEFSTDGCSGGMSSVWSYLAEVSPRFAARLGEVPVWENCCVAHDRHYWQGESRNGYQQRLAADEELRQCVRQTARDQSSQLARSLGLSEQEVIESIDLTADLMFEAVRAGGGPCTGLPWRWGHGWPNCAFDLPLVND
jgi:hypothetical protein